MAVDALPVDGPDRRPSLGGAATRLGPLDPAVCGPWTGRALEALAGRIRRFLVATLSATGGHLGSNLGVVELTLALHRVFDSPADPIVWDTGHQAYVHKLVTGPRRRLRRAAPGGRPLGLSQPGRVGPRPRREQPRLDRPLLRLRHGPGPAAARAPSGRWWPWSGDGALTGGLAYEALNNIGATGARRS